MHNGGSSTSAASVGVLVIVFGALFFVAFRFLGGHFETKGITYYVDLPDASGMTAGTRVVLAGVRIGTVNDVALQSPTSARLTLDIDPKFPIPAGSTAQVPSSIIGLGDTTLAIVPPTTLHGSMPPKSIIPGSKPGPLEAFLPDAKDTIKELNQVLEAAHQLLGDTKLRGSLQGVIETTQMTVAKFGQLSDHLQGMLLQNQSTLNGAVKNAAVAMGDIRKATDLAYKLIKDGKFQQQTTALLASLTKTSDKAQHLVESLDTFASDPKLRDSLNATLSNTKDLTEQGKAIAANVQKMTADGTVASKKAIELTEQATEVAGEAKTLVTKLEGLVDKVSGKIDKVGGSSTGLVGHVTAEADYIRETKPNYNRTDFNFKIPIGKTDVYAGVFDAFGTNKLDLQLGQNFGPNAVLRYGMYAGKPGLGVDYQIVPRLGLRGDVFDLNQPRFDLRARYSFGNGFLGWIGYDRIFDRNGLELGVGIER